MRVYISGISGTGMGPLALFAKNAGFEVVGSDLSQGAVYDELVKAGIEVSVGEQDGEFLKAQLKKGVDWFVYTSALDEKHPELVLAKEEGLRISKRDDFTAYLVEKLGLKMVAVAGTHGKTTTTSMIIWAALKERLPVSYIVGTTLGFATSGAYHKGDKYFIYEADEYDRNFLKYHPWLAVIPAVSYDHPDIYATHEDYLAAFSQFREQSKNVVEWKDDEICWREERNAVFEPKEFKLAGEARRIDAALAAEAVMAMEDEEARGRGEDILFDTVGLVEIIDRFPGVGRRFERISDGVYSDYAHHPEEIAATMNVALEEARILGKKGVVVIYQPHQNVRQHEVRGGYRNAFKGAAKIYWLPTYLVREDTSLPVILPEEFIRDLANFKVTEVAELGDELAEKIRRDKADGYLVILMTAGPADGWLRKRYEK